MHLASYPSGQRELTVNQPALHSGVRIPHLPPDESLGFSEAFGVCGHVVPGAGEGPLYYGHRRCAEPWFRLSGASSRRILQAEHHFVVGNCTIGPRRTKSADKMTEPRSSRWGIGHSSRRARNHRARRPQMVSRAEHSRAPHVENTKPAFHLERRLCVC